MLSNLKDIGKIGVTIAKSVKNIAYTVRNAETISKAISKLTGSTDKDDKFELAIYRLYDEALKIEQTKSANEKMDMNDFMIVEEYPRNKLPIIVCERDLSEDFLGLSKKVEIILQNQYLNNTPSIRRRFRILGEILGIDYRNLYEEAKAKEESEQSQAKRSLGKAK